MRSWFFSVFMHFCAKQNNSYIAEHYIWNQNANKLNRCKNKEKRTKDLERHNREKKSNNDSDSDYDHDHDGEMACLNTLKLEIKTIERIFTKNHERFRILHASVDELTCRFVGKNGKNYDIHANITVIILEFYFYLFYLLVFIFFFFLIPYLCRYFIHFSPYRPTKWILHVYIYMYMVLILKIIIFHYYYCTVEQWVIASYVTVCTYFGNIIVYFFLLFFTTLLSIFD